MINMDDDSDLKVFRIRVKKISYVDVELTADDLQSAISFCEDRINITDSGDVDFLNDDDEKYLKAVRWLGYTNEVVENECTDCTEDYEDLKD